MRFTNQTAVVTGGGSGIGRATALAFAAEGGRVAVADINGEKARETVAAIEARGGRALAVTADLTRREEAVRLAAATVEAFGGIRYLCHSVGLQTYGTVETTDEAAWDRTLAVNLKSMFLAAKYCVPAIRRQGGGAIVNISSVQGLRCQANVSAYAASKGGAIALTRSMALDYAPDNIRVNCICPGSIDTPLLRYGAAAHGEVEAVLREWGRQHPIGRIGTAEEVAQTVLFLFSDAAGFMLGQPIVVDGGLISRIL